MSSAGSRLAPSSSTTTTLTSSSPADSSTSGFCTATAAASLTSGWLITSVSTSNDEMFSPRRRITSLIRSRKKKLPSSSLRELVAGVEPAVAPGFGGRLGHVLVARVDRPRERVPRDELARRVRRHRDVVLVDEPELVLAGCGVHTAAPLVVGIERETIGTGTSVIPYAV